MGEQIVSWLYSILIHIHMDYCISMFAVQTRNAQLNYVFCFYCFFGVGKQR